MAAEVISWGRGGGAVPAAVLSSRGSERNDGGGGIFRGGGWGRVAALVPSRGGGGRTAAAAVLFWGVGALGGSLAVVGRDTDFGVFLVWGGGWDGSGGDVSCDWVGGGWTVTAEERAFCTGGPCGGCGIIGFFSQAPTLR